MSRRFQFNLRALLVAVLAIALPLGGYKLVVANGQALSADGGIAESPTVLHASFVRLSRPRPPTCFFFVNPHHDFNVSSTLVWMPTASVSRSWLIFYAADVELTLDRPGIYDASASLGSDSVRCTVHVKMQE